VKRSSSELCATVCIARTRTKIEDEVDRAGKEMAMSTVTEWIRIRRSRTGIQATGAAMAIEGSED